jgi:hypothetical protein
LRARKPGVKQAVFTFWIETALLIGIENNLTAFKKILK